MRVLLSSLSGHDLTESQHYRTVLQRMGHEVIWVSTPAAQADASGRFWIEQGFAYETSLDSLLAWYGAPIDLFLYIEPNGLIPRGLETAPIPTACILCDTHQWLFARQKLARFFDHVFLYHRSYLQYFSAHSDQHLHWLPYACDLELFRPLAIERDLDVAFVGQPFPQSGRAEVLDKLHGKYRVNQQRFYLRREIPEVYSRAKVVLNMPLKDDLNFRTFEAMSCGAMLLTRRVNNGQEILFQEGVHFAAYADEKEMFEKIDYYLTHEAEREAIAAAGLAEVQRHHQLEQRIDELLNAVMRHPERVAPIRSMTPAQVDREYAWLYEYWRSPGAGLRLVREARLTGRKWLPLLPPAVRSVLRTLFR